MYQHSYIDENGKYHCRMQTRNDGMLKLSDKLRAKRRENSEKLIEKSKKKAAERKEKSKEIFEENLNEKMAASKDGIIYLNDTDIRTGMEAAQEEDAGKTAVKDQAQVGVNLDLKI